MSVKLMARVWEEVDLTRPQQAILLAMADHAQDDGSHCYPSVSRIAWKTGYKPRAVTDIIRDLRKIGVLKIVNPAIGDRPTEYKIVLKNAPQKPPYEEWYEAYGRHSGTGAKPRAGMGAVSRDESMGAESRIRENAPVQSHVPVWVQSDVQNTRENAPRTIMNQREPLIAGNEDIPSKTRRPSVRGDRPEHRLVNAWYDIVGGAPTNHGEDIGKAKTLLSAGLRQDQLPDFITWLRGSFWGRDGVDLGKAVRALNQWQSIQTAPRPVRRLHV